MRSSLFVSALFAGTLLAGTAAAERNDSDDRRPRAVERHRAPTDKQRVDRSHDRADKKVEASHRYQSKKSIPTAKESRVSKLQMALRLPKQAQERMRCENGNEDCTSSTSDRKAVTSNADRGVRKVEPARPRRTRTRRPPRAPRRAPSCRRSERQVQRGGAGWLQRRRQRPPVTEGPGRGHGGRPHLRRGTETPTRASGPAFSFGPGDGRRPGPWTRRRRRVHTRRRRTERCSAVARARESPCSRSAGQDCDSAGCAVFEALRPRRRACRCAPSGSA